MKQEQFTIQEIWDASKTLIHKSKKKYNRTEKHLKKAKGGNFETD